MTIIIINIKIMQRFISELSSTNIV